MPSFKKSFWTIEEQPWKSINQHSIDNYPDEACGILLCHHEIPQQIQEVYPTRNVTIEDPARRYLVDPKDFLKADRWAEQKGLNICGFYHSHPDHPASPSEYDRKLAWEGYLYLIVSIKSGTFDEAKAWIYDSGGKCFSEVEFKKLAL